MDTRKILLNNSWKKRTRKAISIQQKADIIRRAEKGEKPIYISKLKGIPSSSIRSIITNARKIKEKSEGNVIELSKQQSTPSPSDNGVNSTIENTVETSNAFTFSFKHMVMQNGYKSHQIFHVCETVLFWKRIPINPMTVVGQDLERFTLLLGGNAFGDFKLKPLLVYHSENPKALRGFPKDKLPVILKANRKLQVTPLLFSDWFTGYFCPAVERYCLEKNIPHKALLVLNNKLHYPPNLDELSSNVKVIYLPANIQQQIWTSDHLPVKMLKANYLLRTLSRALAAVEAEKVDFLTDFFNDYSIKDAIHNTTDAWFDIRPSTMNSIWNVLYPECLRCNLKSDDSIDEKVDRIMITSKDIGVNVNKDCIIDILEAKDIEITNDEMRQLEQQKVREEFMEEDELQKMTSLSQTVLRKALNHVEAAMELYKNHDPDSERSSSVCRIIEESVSCYTQLMRERKKDQKFQHLFQNTDSFDSLKSSESEICLNAQSQTTSTQVGSVMVKAEPLPVSDYEVEQSLKVVKNS